ncbi:MAG: LysR family transcriptional regulator [Byssovorax sp.]
MFNFHHLHYFWAVAHEENLTRAAQRLHVSQSAVSMQIQKLEADLGHALFERRGKQMLLTEAGRLALDHADAIFARGAELESALRGGGKQRRVLRVGSLATLSRNFQLGFLKPLFEHRDVEIVIRSGAFAELLRVLGAHQIDVVLANAAPPRDAATPWVVHEIAEQPVSLVGHPTKGRRARDLKALLSSEPLVLPAAESSIRAGFDALVDRLGVRPRIAAEVDDMAMLRLLARERIGLAIVPSIVVRDELASRVLVELVPLPQLKETFFAITLSRRFPNPLLKLLMARDDRRRSGTGSSPRSG